MNSDENSLENESVTTLIPKTFMLPEMETLSENSRYAVGISAYCDILEELLMSKMTIKKSFNSRLRERKANKFVFSDSANLIVSTNGEGKSSLVKSIYYALEQTSNHSQRVGMRTILFSN